MVCISFVLNAVVNCKQLMPTVPACWIKTGITDENEKLALIQIVEDNGLDGLLVHSSMVTEPFVEAVKSAGQIIYGGTTDNINKAIDYVELEIDGFLTNRPGWITEQL